MRLFRSLIPVCLFLVALVALPLAAQNLEIHYIDVGWGGSVLVKGPTGITVLLEGGNTGMGTTYVVPYLKSIGVQPANGLDYIIGGHQHCDHTGGLDEVINAGYNVHIKQYYNGSSYASSCVDQWNAAAAGTTAGVPIAMPVGTIIDLGNGATMTCVARNGSIIGGGSVAVTDENDRSIALLIKYGGFDYLWASDLGGGSDACTGRSTAQLDVETSVITAISPGGAHPLISAGGIDLLHVNHHGSESSTNPTYFNMAKPAVAIIGVGDGESAGWDLPRIDVVDHVLLGGSSSCVTAPPTFVLQTEEGNPGSTLMSHSGFCVGNIKVTTDGISIFTVSADGLVHQGPNELVASGLPRSFTIDDTGGGGGDTILPVTSITAPLAGATVSSTTSVTASASDNVGVTKVEFYLDGVLKSTDTTSPYSWSWDTTTATNGSHTLTTKAYDAALNVGTSAAVGVTVSNGVPVNIGGWTLTQANATLNYTIPAGTTIASKGYVLVARNATKAAFQTFWGVTLGANVVYINSADTMPQINGSETYTLKNGATTIDGPTVAMDTSAGFDFERATCGAVGTLSSWSHRASTSGTPGTGGLTTCNRGVFINEFSDALGTGNFVYEFIELFNDR
jgi:beta-lactamase superfamily II metal-dependent hydrolase